MIEAESAGAVQMMRDNLNLRAVFAAAISVALPLLSLPAYAQSTGQPALSNGFRFFEKSGEELFANVCRGCHMSDGKGATGAGTFPSLAGNRNLEASGNPPEGVCEGQRR